MAHETRLKESVKFELSVKNDYNPKLDFYSKDFDPLLALRTPGLVPPVPDAKTYDNLSKYQSALEVRKREKQQQPNAKPAEILKPVKEIERRWLPHQLPIRRERRKVDKNIYTKMESIDGPLALLRKCVETKCRIKVFTRNHAGIRGYCIGVLIVFDKHWNLGLVNVDEVWNRKKKSKIPAYDTATTTTKGIKPQIAPPPIQILKSTSTTETCQRHVNQLMMRGEHVAIVVVLNEDNKQLIK